MLRRLLRALRGDRSPEPPSLPSLLAALREGDVDARRRAAFELGELGDPIAVEPLIAALQGPASGAAAAALGKLGDPRAVEPLVATLRDDRTRHRSLLVEALGTLGDARATAPLVAALGDRDMWTRRRAAAALEALGWRPENDEQRSLRAIATGDWDEVVSVGGPAVDLLLPLLARGPQAPEIATALAQIGDERAIPALSHRLRTGSGFGAEEVLLALARLDPSGAPERWIEALSPERHTGRKVQEAAIRALRDTRPSWDAHTVESLLSLLQGTRPNAAAAAARVLDGATSPEIVSALSAYRERVRTHQRRLAGTAVDALIGELARIGRENGYLRYGGDTSGFETGHNVRAMDIGEELHRRGGMRLMRAAHQHVSDVVGRLPARELEAIWDGIGDWRG